MEGTKESLKNFIRESANDRAKSGAYLLLSQLGQSIKNHGDQFQDVLNGITISSFIRSELSEEFKIEAPKPGSIARMIIPISDKNITTIEKTEKNNQKKISIPEFNKVIWSAFTNEIPNSKRRYLKISQKPFYIDRDRTEPQEDSLISISPEFIIRRNEGIENDQFKEKVANSIESWCQKNGIPYSSSFNKKIENKNKYTNNLATDSILNQLVKKLSYDDMRRISIPLDIVMKLI
ncbi:hypothetical protein [Chromobacterium sinusclupearum]|uniref:hypothetical protein n=1 Tax=Chromobacterium sinusclupearum TaxID=2077146 RepID=UPI0011AF2162|nr:hypothetical protein [Chromobacterium sinusclupearum]